MSKPESETKNLFKTSKNPALELARAFLIYSLVPYLGILFAPGAIVMGGVAAFGARRPGFGEPRTAFLSVVLSLLVCAAQIMLWWLLYIVPELGRNF